MVASQKPTGDLPADPLHRTVLRLTSPSASIRDHVGQRRSRLLSTVLLILILAAVFMGIAAEVLAEGWAVWRDDDLWITIGVLVILIPLYFFSRTRYSPHVAKVLIVLTSVATFVIALPHDDASDANMLVYLLIPVVLSSVLLPYRATALLIAAQTVGTVIFAVGFRRVSSDYDWSGFVFITSLMILFAARHASQTEHEHRVELATSEDITDRILEANPDPAVIWERQPDGRVILTQINIAASTTSHGSLAGFLGVTAQEFYGHDPEITANILHVLDTGETIRREMSYLLRTTGETRWMLVDFTRVGTNQVLHTLRDLTERRNIEEALRESDARYRLIFEQMSSAFALHEIICDEQGKPIDYRFLEVNPAFEAFTGLKAENIVGRRVREVLPDIESSWIERYGRVALTGESIQFVDYYRSLDKYYDVRAFSTRPRQFAVTFFDVSERYRAEQALRKSETRQRALLEAIPDLIFRLDRDGVFLDYKSSNITLITQPEKFLGQSIRDVLPQRAEETLAHIARVLDTGQIGVSEYELEINGERRDYEARYSPGGEDQVIAMVRDVTDLKRAQKERSATEAKLQSIFRSSPIGIGLMIDQVFVEVNDQTCAITGYSRDELIGQSARILHLTDEEFEAVGRANSVQIRQSAFGAMETRWRRKDGQIIDVQVSVSALNRDDVGQGFTFAVQDITGRKRIENAEREQRAFSDALRDTAAAISSTLDLDEVLARILANIEPVVAHDAANIMLLEGNIGYIAGSRGYEVRGTQEWINTTLVNSNDRPGLMELLKTGQAYLIKDTFTDPLWQRRPETEWVRSLLSIPIRMEGRVIGVLNLDSAHTNAFTQTDLNRAQAFADQAGAAIRNARLYAEVRHYTDELERRVTERTTDLSVRNAVAETLSSSLDMQEMLDGVLRTTVERLGILGAAIHLLSPDANSMEIAAAYGITPETVNRITGLGMVGSQTPAFELIADEWEGNVDLIQETGVRAAISVPIWQQEQVQGVITVMHDQPRPWSNDETRMIDVIGRQIGAALANARLYAQVVRDEANLRTILQSVGDGLLVFDHHHHLTLMNPAAERLFAFYPAERGGPARAAALLWEWFRLRPEDRARERTDFYLPTQPVELEGEHGLAARCKVKNCSLLPRVDPVWPCWLQPGLSDEDQWALCAARQTLVCRAIQLQATEVRSTSGEVQSMVIALHDVTHFRELDQLKDRFVSNVSHELRNPLSSIMLQISTLLRYYERFAEEDRHRMLVEIQQQAYVLRELIEEILELSRFDAGRSVPQKEWFDLAGQSREVIGTLELSAREKNQTLELSGFNGPRYILADPHQIIRVLRNLITNAIKYTPDNGRISLALVTEGGQVRLSVADTGIGIAPEDQANVFDRFYRTVEASEMASGTGLGLSITKEIIELHGGRIEVQSTPGQGSTFTVLLPVSGIPLAGEIAHPPGSLSIANEGD